MNVVIYARYSSDRQTEQSIEGQLKECYAYAKRNDCTVVGEYIDRAISGTTDHRPEFQHMIADSSKKHFQGVLVYQLDRFARNRLDSATYRAILKRNGVRVLSARENISEDASGILMEAVLEGMAEYYSAELSQKIQRGMDINAEHGYVTGGNVALGYKTEIVEGTDKKRFVVDETTVPVVKRIFEMYADENKTMVEICRHLNEQGVRTSRGVHFNKNSLRLMLQNKRYCGIYTYKGMEFPGRIPRIIEDDLFERVQKALKKNKKAPAKNKAVGKDEYILTLKLFCGHCKESMTGWSGNGKSGKKHRYYICNGRKKKLCDKKNVRKGLIEDIVVQQCRKMLTDKNIEKIANDIVAYNEAEQRNNVNLKRLERLVADNEKQQKNLMNTLKLCESDDTKRIILTELSQMDKEAKELQIQLTLEESRKIKIFRHELVFFLKDLQNGDASDIKYRKVLITTLVNKIYLYDDGRLTIVFYNGDSTIEVDINIIDMIESDIPVSENSRGYFIGNVLPPQFVQKPAFLSGFLAFSGFIRTIFPTFMKKVGGLTPPRRPFASSFQPF